MSLNFSHVAATVCNFIGQRDQVTKPSHLNIHNLFLISYSCEPVA